MARLSDLERQDLETLKQFLLGISRFFHWLVTDTSYLPRGLDQPFRDVLPIARERIEDATEQLDKIDDTETPLWRGLDNAGLVGSPLALKAAIWERTVSATSSAAPPSPGGFTWRLLRPLLQVMNSLLGSLTSIFPPLELAKEYKEGMETVIDDQRSGPPPPESILGLR